MLVLAPLTLAKVVVARSPPFEWRALAAALIVGLLPGYGAYQAYSWLLLGEAMRGYHLAGAMLALGGVWLASRGATGRS